jgi:hypothetical protein
LVRLKWLEAIFGAISDVGIFIFPPYNLPLV